MISRIFISVVLAFYSCLLEARIEKRSAAEFHEMIMASDIIVLGTVESTESSYSESGGVFTIAFLNNAFLLGANGKQKLDKAVPIYFMGGLVPNSDESGEVDSEYPYVMTLIAGTPNINVGDRAVYFLSGNGSEPIPFLSGERGIIRIGSGNRLYSNEGDELINLGSELKFMRKNTSEGVVLISTTSLGPVSDVKQVVPLKSRPKLNELVKYIKEIREESDIPEQNSGDVYSPKKLKRYFKKKEQ